MAGEPPPLGAPQRRLAVAPSAPRGGVTRYWCSLAVAYRGSWDAGSSSPRYRPRDLLMNPRTNVSIEPWSPFPPRNAVEFDLDWGFPLHVERIRNRDRSVLGGNMFVRVGWDEHQLQVPDIPGTVALRRGYPLRLDGSETGLLRTVPGPRLVRTMAATIGSQRWTIERSHRRTYV